MSSGRRQYNFKPWLGAFATLVICAWVSDRPLRQPQRVFGAAESVQIEEAQALWRGTFALSERRHDTAEFEGRVYSYFPPMYTFLAALIVLFFGGVPHFFFVALAGMVVVLAYMLFLRLTGSAAWAVVFSLAFIIGTSHWPVLDRMLREAKPYAVNHVLASIGLLLILLTLAQSYLKSSLTIADESSDRPEARQFRESARTEVRGSYGFVITPGHGGFALACLGLVVAGLSRQMTVAFALPLCYLAWQEGRQGRGWTKLAIVVVSVAAVGGVTMALNAAKFANPFDSGYTYNYVGRDDVFARDAREFGLFSPHYIPRNLYYLGVAGPQLHKIEMKGKPEWYLRPDEMGAGILWTTPLLIFAFFGWSRVKEDRVRLLLLCSIAAIFVALLFWHGTGSVQKGFHRYSLDFVPALFFLLVPVCLATLRRRWLTVVAVSWSILYFAVLLQLPHIRVW